MAILHKVMAEAKRIHKKFPSKKWTDCVKDAWKKVKRPGVTKKKVSGTKKRIPEKTVLKKIRVVKKAVNNLEKTQHDHMIGAIRKGSKFIYYKGHSIEKKPIILTDGKRKKKIYVYVAFGTVFHRVSEAKSHINYLAK